MTSNDASEGDTGRETESLVELIARSPQAGAILDRIETLVRELGAADIRSTKSQIAFRRRRAFAWAWVPGQYLRARDLAPLVLSISLPRRDPSPRWKEVGEPSPGRFMHHLELRSPGEVDVEVEGWLAEAWAAAG